jgi:hypothetical protein
MRRSVSLLIPLPILAVVGLTSPAFADCPPGAWFCADVTVPGPQAPDEKAPDVDTKKDKADKKAMAPAETTTTHTANGTTTTTVVPGSSGATTVIVNTAPPTTEARPAPPPPPPRVHAPPPPPTYEPPPPAMPPKRPRSEWGLNLRLDGALMGDKAAQGAGMGGLGFSLRARPTPHFALDFGLDFIGGTDWQGQKRSEVPFAVNAMLFVNPKSKAQVYFLGGLGWSSATVAVAPGDNEHFGYFGVQGGVGIEFRVSRTVGIDIDGIGFVRGRTDSGATSRPEFTDPATGRTTNTSGGGLFRGGLTLYW